MTKTWSYLFPPCANDKSGKKSQTVAKLGVLMGIGFMHSDTYFTSTGSDLFFFPPFSVLWKYFHHSCSPVSGPASGKSKWSIYCEVSCQFSPASSFAHFWVTRFIDCIVTLHCRNKPWVTYLEVDSNYNIFCQLSWHIFSIEAS